jgi:hypothetical protein
MVGLGDLAMGYLLEMNSSTPRVFLPLLVHNISSPLLTWSDYPSYNHPLLLRGIRDCQTGFRMARLVMHLAVSARGVVRVLGSGMKGGVVMGVGCRSGSMAGVPGEDSDCNNRLQPSRLIIPALRCLRRGCWSGKCDEGGVLL